MRCIWFVFLQLGVTTEIAAPPWGFWRLALSAGRPWRGEGGLVGGDDIDCRTIHVATEGMTWGLIRVF